MKLKACAYVTRLRQGTLELLAFIQEDHADAGIQVPGGTVDPGERPEETVLRELAEETGLAGLDITADLGCRSYFHKQKQESHERHYFHIESEGLPDSWTHTVSSGSADRGLRFSFFWMPLAMASDLAGRQGEQTYLLTDESGFELRQIVRYVLRIARKCMKRNLLPDDAMPDVSAAFCQDDSELVRLTDQMADLGKAVEETSTGTTYRLTEPIICEGDVVDLIKLRRPDPSRIWRGDVDYRVTDRAAVKELLVGRSDVEIITRPTYEMLELTDPLSDALIYFSEPPLSKELS